jgi:hypothetical protein
MCHDYDAYLLKARIAEHLRRKKPPVADDLEKQRGAKAPDAPREPEKHGKDREPAPA